MKRKINYDYAAMEEGVTKILDNILAVGNPYSRIVGISRGGLIPAVMLSYKLKLPLTTISWSLRDALERESNAWIPMDVNNGQRILLVDDIIDSGNTISEILTDWDENVGGTLERNNISVAALWYNTNQDLVTPDFWHETIDRSKDDRWVEFWFDH